MNIAENLRKFRIASNSSQAFIAKKLNITRQAYNHYETGRREPDYNTLVEIAKIFGTTPDNIMGFPDDSTPQKKENPSSNMLDMGELSEESRKDLIKQFELLKMRDTLQNANELPDGIKQS